MTKHKILILTTGGAITSVPSQLGYIPTEMNREKLHQEIPSLSDIAEYDLVEVCREDSENLHPEDWQTIGNVINKEFNNYAGFLLLHGTDTLAYTTAALSFFFLHTPKPIVAVSGSSIFSQETEIGRKEVRDGFLVASQIAHPGVYLSCDQKVHLGTRVKKSYDILNTYQSSIEAPFASIKDSKIIVQQQPKRSQKGTFQFNAALDTNIMVQRLFPGLNPTVLLQQLLVQQPHAVVFVVYGSGCLPIRGKSSLIPLIQECQERNLPVISVSPSVKPSVHIDVWAVGREILKLEVISALDMTEETTIVKLMWLLAQNPDKSFIEKELVRNFCGEIA